MHQFASGAKRNYYGKGDVIIYRLQRDARSPQGQSPVFGARVMMLLYGDAFWPTYFMLAYTLLGLWAGTAFVVIGFAITALTVASYFLSGSYFGLTIAAVNGLGLILAGLWMWRQ